MVKDLLVTLLRAYWQSFVDNSCKKWSCNQNHRKRSNNQSQIQTLIIKEALLQFEVCPKRPRSFSKENSALHIIPPSQVLRYSNHKTYNILHQHPQPCHLINIPNFFNIHKPPPPHLPPSRRTHKRLLHTNIHGFPLRLNHSRRSSRRRRRKRWKGTRWRTHRHVGTSIVATSTASVLALTPIL
jgi:hypothetical protein